MGGTGLAVDAIGVGGEPEPSPVAADILPVPPPLARTLKEILL